jgi:hypothetical protein
VWDGEGWSFLRAFERWYFRRKWLADEFVADGFANPCEPEAEEYVFDQKKKNTLSCVVPAPLFGDENCACELFSFRVLPGGVLFVFFSCVFLLRVG